MAGRKLGVPASEMMALREHGMSNAEIAKNLGCSVQTVVNYIGKQPAEMTKANKAAVMEHIRPRAKFKSATEDMLTLREHGMSNKEIAEALGVDVATVRNRIGKQPEELTMKNKQKAAASARAKKKTDSLEKCDETTPDSLEKCEKAENPPPKPVVEEEPAENAKPVVEPPRPLKKEKPGALIETNLLRFAYFPTWFEQLHILKEMAQPEPWKFRDLDWDANNPETPILGYHLNRVFQKVASLYNAHPDREADKFVYIKGDTACFNTGLQTSLFQDIYAVFGRNMRSGVQPWYFREFATDTLNSVSHVHPLPVPFQSACPSLGAFHPERDIRVAVKHITTNPKNRERIPESIRDAWNLPLLIQASVDMSRRKAITEPDMVVRAVNLNRDTSESNQTYLLPLWLTRPEAPDLVLVMKEENGYYFGVTALTPHMAYGNARLFGRPTAKWLTDLLAEE